MRRVAPVPTGVAGRRGAPRGRGFVAPRGPQFIGGAARSGRERNAARAGGAAGAAGACCVGGRGRARGAGARAPRTPPTPANGPVGCAVRRVRAGAGTTGAATARRRGCGDGGPGVGTGWERTGAGGESAIPQKPKKPQRDPGAALYNAAEGGGGMSPMDREGGGRVYTAGSEFIVDGGEAGAGGRAAALRSRSEGGRGRAAANRC